MMYLRVERLGLEWKTAHNSYIGTLGKPERISPRSSNGRSCALFSQAAELKTQTRCFRNIVSKEFLRQYVKETLGWHSLSCTERARACSIKKVFELGYLECNLVNLHTRDRVLLAVEWMKVGVVWMERQLEGQKKMALHKNFRSLELRPFTEDSPTLK